MKRVLNFLNMRRAVLVFAGLAVLLVLRKPDNIFMAQFVAEDGRYWFADCYRLGLECLLLAQDGYLQTVSRLGGLAAQLFPLAVGPTVFALLAFVIQMLPAGLLLSRRLEKTAPSFWARALLALLYIVMPNTGGSVLFLTCSQWFLALTSAVIITFPASGRAGKWFDRFIVLLSGLSGPFAVLLLPVSILKWIKSRNRHDLTLLLILIATAAVQAYFVLTFKDVTPRFEGEIPWSLRSVYSAVQIQVVWNLLLSPEGYWWMHAASKYWHYIAAFGAAPVFAMTAYAFYKLPYQAKLYFMFAGGILLVGLLYPMGIDRSNLFYNLANNTEQLRYWLVPMTAVLTSLVYCAGGSRPVFVRWPARAYLALLVVGVFLNFRLPPTPDYHFKDYVRQFEEAQPGETIKIPLHPVPSYWIMELTKQSGQ